MDGLEGERKMSKTLEELDAEERRIKRKDTIIATVINCLIVLIGIGVWWGVLNMVRIK